MTNGPYYPTLEHTAKFYQTELEQIYDFLTPLHGIWAQEVLNEYPKPLAHYPDSWLSAMKALSLEEEWQIELGDIPQQLSDSGLLKLFRDLETLEDLPVWNFDPLPSTLKDYPSWALNYVTEKKQHEILRISSLLKQSIGEDRPLKMIDIGGGKGHLARILALYHGHHLTSLDTNLEFQKLGKERLDKYPYPEGAGSLTFIHHTFGPHSHSNKLDQKIFSDAEVTLGLHTCGPLALEHIKSYEPHQNLYNFGCCYQKLTEENLLLSQFAKNQVPLDIGKYALTLATRGHTKITQKAYQLKKRVKFFRAALHLWMAENTQNNTFITVGSARPKDYYGSFGDYALKKLEPFNLYEKKETLEAYYQRKETQEHLSSIFHANLIRWRFGRILEKFILMDRALWQVERGHRAQLYQIFASEISPRNTVLFIPKIP